MSIGLGAEAAGLGVQAAQASHFAGLPSGWPRPFRDAVPFRAGGLRPSPGWFPRPLSAGPRGTT
jgi:hypothetical protein